MCAHVMSSVSFMWCHLWMSVRWMSHIMVVGAACCAAQVRQLVAAAGLQLLALKRVRVGGFILPRNLPVGSFR